MKAVKDIYKYEPGFSEVREGVQHKLHVDEQTQQELVEQEAVR